MAEKSLNAILKMRYDSYTNWMNADPILKKGETAVVLVESESADVQPVVLSKIGNGTDKFSVLPWSSANAADVYEWAKQENKPTYTSEEVGAVSYTHAQSLSDDEKNQVRSNIGIDKIADNITWDDNNNATFKGAVTTNDGNGIKIDGNYINFGKTPSTPIYFQNRVGFDTGFTSSAASSVSSLISYGDIEIVSGKFIGNGSGLYGLPKDTFIVTFSLNEDTVVANKTFDEIFTAMDDGKLVIGMANQFSDRQLLVKSFSEDAITFETYWDFSDFLTTDKKYANTATLTITSNNTVQTGASGFTLYTATGADDTFATKTSVDNKLDKVLAPNVVYVTDLSCNQTTLGYSASSDNTAGQLAVRATDGGINVPLTPGSTSRATSKYYVDNNFVSYNTFSDNNMNWGGANKSANVSPVDAAIIPTIGGNKFELCKPDGVTVEYSTDSGSTWTDYGLTDLQKVAQLSVKSNATPIYIGKKTSAAAATTDQVRLTVNATQCGVYTQIKKILIYVSTNGATSCKVSIGVSADGTSWTSLKSNITIDGWSGWNSLPITQWVALGQYGNYNYMRFTFSIGGVGSSGNSNLAIYNILPIGITNFINPSNISETGHLYSYDYQGNATFPANVSALSGSFNSLDVGGNFRCNGDVEFNSNVTVIASNIEVVGGNISATKFVGDGSGLTNLPSSGGATEYTASIPMTGWTQNTDTESYFIDVPITGLKADYTTAPIVDFDTSGYTNMSMLKADLAEWAKVLKIAAAAGKITVYANEQPGTELPIRIKVIE